MASGKVVLRWMTRACGGLAATVLLSTGVPATAQTAVAPVAVPPSPWWKLYLAGSKAIALPDGRHLNLYCEGSGGPTVVLESGRGGGAWSWSTVQSGIAKTFRVCVYDRAGYLGMSSPAPGDRSAGAEADDLAALLKAARIDPPYVLVGHSLGGYIVRLFAYRHPGQVTGLVLVDTSSEYQTKPLNAVMTPAMLADEAALPAKAQRCAVEPRAAGSDCILRKAPADLPPDLVGWFEQAQGPAYADAIMRETLAMDTTSSAQLVSERRSLGDIPVILLERDISLIPPGPWPSETLVASSNVERTWHDLHVATLSGISTRLSLRSVPGAGHRVQDTDPGVIVAAVREAAAGTTAR